MSVKEMLTANLGLKALSLFLAATLWLFVTMGMEGEEEVRVPVRVINILPHLSIENQVPPVVDLRIAGPKILLMRLDKEQLIATLDLQEVGVGNVAFPDMSGTVRLSSGLRITRISPANVQLKLVEKARRH